MEASEVDFIVISVLENKNIKAISLHFNRHFSFNLISLKVEKRMKFSGYLFHTHYHISNASQIGEWLHKIFYEFFVFIFFLQRSILKAKWPKEMNQLGL
jgi:hypothetical protein